MQNDRLTSVVNTIPVEMVTLFLLTALLVAASAAHARETLRLRTQYDERELKLNTDGYYRRYNHCVKGVSLVEREAGKQLNCKIDKELLTPPSATNFNSFVNTELATKYNICVLYVVHLERPEILIYTLICLILF